MDWLFSLNSDASNWLWNYRNVLVTSWIAVLLVLYGDNINRLLKRAMQPYHYILRMLSFVLLCSFGYGLLANYGEVAVSKLVGLPDRNWFAGMVISIYFVLGILAERKNQA
ncbi:DUF3392 family protein [Paraneptunicella aestuarii]|uniref:DUF3392 family protein n=1 Tax=Paraneptunicella aestuarii TaxID=2831148 RepID=UPI001E453306|nr:DUF3392 family protein [Paraneptunicella aestuarii]UAA39059.1 DUF3392 family protein [Paraneptunicella aestuarii]